MAMTKKEQQAMEDLKTRLALRYTGPAPERDVLPPTAEEIGSRLSRGFTFNAHSRRIFPACSSSIYHRIGSGDRVDTRGAIRLYSTPILALQALRVAVEEECAKQLRAIDLMIEKEEAKP